MKNKVPKMVVLSVIFIVALLIWKRSYDHTTATGDVKAESKLPDFKFYGLNSKTFSGSDIPRGKNVCVIFFDPDCDYCESEIALITKNINLFNSTQILLVSISSPAKVKGFYDRLHLANYSNVNIMCDKDFSFQNLFGKSIIPSTYIYDKDRVLLKEYHGLVKIEAITKWLK